jgi:hypothetical protein
VVVNRQEITTLSNEKTPNSLYKVILKAIWRPGADNPTLEKTVVTKSEEEIAGYFS